MIVLGRFGYVKEIAYYEIINQMFTIAVFPFMIMAQVIAPDISRMAAKGEKERMCRRKGELFRLLRILSLAVAVILYVLGITMIKMFFPAYYDKSMIFCLNILILLLPVKIWGVVVTR